MDLKRHEFGSTLGDGPFFVFEVQCYCFCDSFSV